MKIAHTLIPGAHKSGLYETTLEIISAEISAGHDSRAVDPLYGMEGGDRGVPFTSRLWMAKADILVNHSGIGRSHEGLAPVVAMMHGSPKYCFAMEHYHGVDMWKKVMEMVTLDYPSAYVAYPQDMAGWQLLIPSEKLFEVRPCVDLAFWTPVGPEWDYSGEHTNIVITDRWRPTKDSFGLLAGFSRFAKNHPNAKLHIYGAPDPCIGPLASILNKFKTRGILGEVKGDVSAEDLRTIYRAADVVMTPVYGVARTIREAMACGCPVLMGQQGGYGQTEVDTENADAIAYGLHAVLDHNTRASQRTQARKQAETLFAPSDTMNGLQAVYERVLKGL